MTATLGIESAPGRTAKLNAPSILGLALKHGPRLYIIVLWGTIASGSKRNQVRLYGDESPAATDVDCFENPWRSDSLDGSECLELLQ